MLTVTTGVLALILSACGRSGPERAAPVDPGQEPATAGVAVVSEEPVVAPAAVSSTVPASAPTSTAAPQPGGTYVVQPGDTLSAIARQFGVTIEALSQANGITDVNSIQPGQELAIPAG